MVVDRGALVARGAVAPKLGDAHVALGRVGFARQDPQLFAVARTHEDGRGLVPRGSQGAPCYFPLGSQPRELGIKIVEVVLGPGHECSVAHLGP